ncbi:MAG: YggS family pyridoxal phosphate-dependent enzyme [Planctomycetes bacterium]|nr:YggS family pyridoxal phosphate-dependent enzyme [Planctomycetota bacterium]
MATTMAHAETLQSRYTDVCARITRAAQRSGRSSSEIILVAVTKTADPEQIRTLLHLGHRDFGENKAQTLIQHAAIVEEFFTRQTIHAGTRKMRTDEASQMLFRAGPTLTPIENLPNARDGLRWHMIGHLQRNKAKKVCDIARLIHSVDSLRLAEELQTVADRKDHTIDILLQVNCSGEASKFGCLPAAAIPLAEQIGSMVNIRLRGLMTMAAPGKRPEDSRTCFERCRELFEEMKKEGVAQHGPFNILSMGMSGDFEVAIEEGANIVRVGSAIFGEPSVIEAPEAPEPPEGEETEE